MIKEFGLGLAAAVVVDATIVRLALVPAPAVMQILGETNWRLPRWLDHALPHLDVEGSSARGTFNLAPSTASEGSIKLADAPAIE